MPSDFSTFVSTLTSIFKNTPQEKLDELLDPFAHAKGGDPAGFRGVSASLPGAENTTRQSSPDADHGDPVTRLYTMLGDMAADVAATKKSHQAILQALSTTTKWHADTEHALLSLGKTVAALAGVSSKTLDDAEGRANSDKDTKPGAAGPDWQAEGATPGKNPDDDQDNPTAKSLAQVFSELHDLASGVSRSTVSSRLATPPQFTAIKSSTAASANTEITDEEIEGMDFVNATEALLLRQREFHGRRLGLI